MDDTDSQDKKFHEIGGKIQDVILDIIRLYLESRFEGRRLPKFDKLYNPLKEEMRMKVTTGLSDRYPASKIDDLYPLIRSAYEMIRRGRGDSSPRKITGY